MLANVSSRSRRILVADDDPVTRRLISSFLRKEGYTAVEAADGCEAVRVLNSDDDFRAAFLDMAMPRLKGVDVMRHMKTEKRLMRIPVILMTSETDPRVVADSFAAGALAFLPKPLRPGQLRIVLRVMANKSVGPHGWRSKRAGQLAAA